MNEDIEPTVASPEVTQAETPSTPKRTRHNLTEDDLIMAANLYYQRNSRATIITMLKGRGISASTTYQLIREIEDNPSHSPTARIRPGPKKDTVGRWTPEVTNCVLNYISDHPLATLDMIKDKILETFHFTFHVSWIHRKLEDNLITFKSTHIQPYQTNSEEIIEDRYIYANEYMQMLHTHRHVFDTSPNDGRRRLLKLFIDESHFSVIMRRGRGRARKNFRVIDPILPSAGHHVTVIVAVSDDVGLFRYETCIEKVNGDRFNVFLDGCLNHELVLGDSCEVVLIMDNASIHRKQEIEAILNDKNQLRTNQISVSYLPRYSPFLNIAENVFQMWKSAAKNALEVRRNEIAATITAPWGTRLFARLNIILDVINETTQAVTVQKMRDCHQRLVEEFIPKSLHRLPITT